MHGCSPEHWRCLTLCHIFRSSLFFEKFRSTVFKDLTEVSIYSRKFTAMREVSDRTAFLSRSHFKIGQDDVATDPSLESVFKRDYPPLGIHGRPSAIDPPPPVKFHHSDDR